MGQAYSMDLRERVMKDVDKGMRVSLVAEKYSVSKWWIYELKKRRKATGSIAAGQQGCHKPRAVEDSAMLVKLVADHPDTTLAEMQALLKEQGIEIKITTLWYNLAYAKLSYKKNRARQRAGT